MKMISNTSMTSTIGVTLIAPTPGLRRCRPLPKPPKCAPPLLMAMPANPLLHAAFVDLTRQDCRELVGKALHALGLPVHVGDELVIENRRRDGGDKADCGRKQRLGDARRHNR